LLPGDVIVTGTPGGVGAKRTPPMFVKTGDVVEIEVSQIDVLRNSVVNELAHGCRGPPIRTLRSVQSDEQL
jgi:2-keto-4-pentenoate hydratase/2-oxohepta-3-ene-1,7-dioic acid hydratase in catechol pathway